MTSYVTGPEVVWGDIVSSEEASAGSSPQSPGVQGGMSQSRSSGGGGGGGGSSRGSGSVLLYQSAPPQNPTGSHRPPFSSPVPVSVPFAAPDHTHISTHATSSTSTVDRGSVGKGFDIPIEFKWKSVSGILVLGLSPYPSPDLCSTPNPGSTLQDALTDITTQYSPFKFGINLASENNDKGRKMVSTILQSLAKSVYDMYKSDKKRKLLISQKETIRKLR